MRAMLSILTVAVLVLFSAPAAFAAVDATYNVFEAILEDDGTVTTTTTPIPGPISVDMYALDASTSTVISTIFTGASFGTNSIALTGATAYPTSLPGGATYWGVYVYRSGYIPLEIRADWQGTGTAPGSPYTGYLMRVRNCRAPTVDLTVQNSAQANIPLVIGVAASLSSSAYAPIQSAGPLTFTPGGIADYNVNVDVTVEIRNSVGTLVATLGPTTLSIPYSQSATASFSWTPTVADTYTITATGAPNDGKCMSSVSQATTKQTTVLGAAPSNMCYTLLQNLTYLPIYTTSGNPVSITVQKISNHVDASGTVFTAIPTQLTIDIVGASTGQVAGFPATSTVAANPDTTNYVTVPTPAWTFTPAAADTYTITVTGVGSDPLCSGLTNNAETMTLSFYVYSPAPPPPPPPPPPPGPGPGSSGGGSVGGPLGFSLLLKTTTFASVDIPQEIGAGKQVVLSGVVNEPPFNGYVEAYIDGEIKGDGAIGTDGSFRIVLGPQEIGEHKLRLRVRGSTAEITQDIIVHADVKVTNVVADKFVIGERAPIDVELEVSWPSEVEVRVFVDGELLAAKKAAVTERATIGFDYTPDSTGEKEIRAIALIFGSTSERRAKITVEERAPVGITGLFAAVADFLSQPLGLAIIVGGVIAGLAVLFKKSTAFKAAVLAALALLGAKFARLRQRLPLKKLSPERQSFKKAGAAVSDEIRKIAEAVRGKGTKAESNINKEAQNTLEPDEE